MEPCSVLSSTVRWGLCQHNENQEAEDVRTNTEAWDIAGDVNDNLFNGP